MVLMVFMVFINFCLKNNKIKEFLARVIFVVFMVSME